MSNDKENTIVDDLWRQIKNNKFFALIIVVGGIIIAISSFSESLLKLIQSTDDFIDDDQEINVISNSQEDRSSSLPTIKSSSFNDYLNENIKVAQHNSGDIINLSKDEISIDFAINNENGNVSYVIEKVNDQIEINPYNTYLSSLKNGGPIYPISYWYSPFDFQFPALDFKVVNNSDRTIFFTKAIFKVSQSKSDLFPILLIKGTGYNMNFPLTNIGWGPVKNCSMKFNLVTPDIPTNYKNGYEHELIIGDFDYSSDKTNLANFFKEIGVNVDIIKQGYTSATYGSEGSFYTILNEKGNEVTLTEQEYEARMTKALGKFQNGVAKIFGEIHYGGLNSTGNYASEKLKFEGEIVLGRPGDGMPAPPSFVYDVSFDADNINYTRSVDISQAIKSGEFDRFNIKISAPKSSRHNFELALVYNNNKQLIVPNIMLNYFMTEPDSSFITNEKINDIDF